MKKLFIILSIYLLPMALPAQLPYHPFPANTGTWTYRYYDDFHNPTSLLSSFSMLGDTVISGMNYKKILSGSAYIGALRESGKFIYYYPDTASQEYVLYNFNLNSGDTLFHPYGLAASANDTVVVDVVDTVLFDDGYHRELHFNHGTTWIEGIGSLNYFFAPSYILSVSGNFLLEFMEGDSTVAYSSSPPPPPPCVSYFYTSYDSTLNSFNLSIPPLPLVSSYLWDFGDGSTSTAPHPSHFYPVDSIYNVCLNITNTSGDTCSYCHLIGKDSLGNIVRNGGFWINASPTGTPGAASLQENTVTMYPNPASNRVTIRLNGATGNIAVKIINIAGQTVIEKEDLSENVFDLDVSVQPKGIYFVEIINGTNITRRKLIKN